MNTIMNKIKYFSLLLMALPLLLTSCLKDDNEVFSDSASKRLQQALEDTRSILRSSEQGWVMDYYVGTDQAYGGYAFIVKFDSLTVTAQSELNSTPATSYYKLTTDNGPVLTFDTYNQVLHELATPSASNYEAYHADYEFQIVSATPELVLLRGRRTNNVMQLRPLTTTPTDYLAKVAETENTMLVGSLGTKVNGDSLKATIDLDARSISFANRDSSYTLSTTFAYTDKGIRLYEPAKCGGYTLSDFTYDPSTMAFKSLDKGSEQLAIQGSLPDTYVYYDQIAGDYTFTFQLQDEKDKKKFTDVNVDVTLEPNDDKTGFVMKGLGQGFDIVLEYNKSKGTLAMNSQIVGKVGSNNLWLNAADFADGGGLYPGLTSCGMNATWNKDMEKPVLNFKTNDFEAMPTDSYCLWTLTTAGENVGQYRDSEYSIAGYLVMTYVRRLTKKTPFPAHVK